MKKASWVLIAVAGALTVLASLASVSNAYFRPDEQVGPVTLRELAQGREDVAIALKARRGTAAAYAAAFGVLLLAIALGPYRRGDVWAWWAILAGALTQSLLVLMRIPFLGTRAGTAAAALTLVVVGLGLALDTRRLRRPDDDGLARTR
jgi:hypothetical protein